MLCGADKIDEVNPKKEKRDFSLRKPTLSPRNTIRDAKSAQERKRKKESACYARNDGRKFRSADSIVNRT